MRITIEDRGGGYHDIVLTKKGKPSVTTVSLTGHDLDDLLAVLTQRKAMAPTCPATTGEHTCGLAPPPHYAGIHVCRACPHTWTQS